MNRETLQHLKKLAENATPGKWEAYWQNVDRHIDGAIGCGNRHIALCNMFDSRDEEQRVTREQCRANAMFIAACCPETVLELIATIEKLEQEQKNAR